MSDDRLPEWPETFIDNKDWPLTLHYAHAYEHEQRRAEAALARLRVAVEWINTKAKHNEDNGKCYGLVRGRWADDPPDMVYEEHKCRCGLDALKAAIGDLPHD